jgi:hypothetical protein
MISQLFLSKHLLSVAVLAISLVNVPQALSQIVSGEVTQTPAPTFNAEPNSSVEQTFSPEDFTDKRFEQYEQQLNAILKTRRDEERKFISDIVLNVREGKLPSKIIQTSFRWVQKKRPDTNFPFIYFERLLRLQVAKAGIEETVPPFDFNIYRTFDTGVRSFQRGGSPITQGAGLSGNRNNFAN